MTGTSAGRDRSPHELRCAERIRLRVLLQAGEPAEAPVAVLHHAAALIAQCCGHTPLKAHRLAWGWTVDRAIRAFHQMCDQQQLKPRGLTERSWLGWEAGEGTSDDYRDRLSRLFQTNGIQLGFAADYTPATLVAGGADSHLDVPSDTSASNAPPELPAHGRPSGTGDHTNRRQALRVLGAATAGATTGGVLAQPTVEAMEYTRHAETTEVGTSTIEHLELVIAGMAATFAYAPPGDLFQRARAYRQHVGQVIRQRKYTLREGRDLYRCAGWLSIIMGWLSHDLGDSTTGEAYCLDAWQHGWQSENGDICAWAMDAAATIAMYNNRPAAARDAALKGLSQAPRAGAAAVRVSCQLTRAYARLGDAGKFRESLKQTQQSLSRLPEFGSGLFSADAGRIASYAATSSIWLRRPELAVSYAREALSFYDQVNPQQRSPTRQAISRLDLGLALVHLKGPDEATEEATRALDTERVTRTVLARAADVDAALRHQYPTHRGVIDFHERYAAMVGHMGHSQITAG